MPGQAQAAWTYVAAMQGAVANIWDGKGMQKVMQATQNVIERLSGVHAARNDGPDDLTAIRKVLEQCPRVPQAR